MTARLSDFAQGLDCDRRADHPTYLHVVVQQRDELNPCVVPQSDHRWVALPPFLGQLVERRTGRGSVDRGVDRLHVTLDLIPAFPGRKPKYVVQQMNAAHLHDRLRPDAADHLGQSLQPVADDEKRVRDAAVAQVGHHGHPDLRTLPTGVGPRSEDVAFPAEGDPHRGVERPVGAGIWPIWAWVGIESSASVRAGSGSLPRAAHGSSRFGLTIIRATRYVFFGRSGRS